MNTPAHLIIGAAAFARPNAVAINIAAIAGALLPDFSLYFMVFWYSNVLGVDEAVIFNQVYFSDVWQRVFSIDNSFPLWGAGLVVSALLRKQIAIAFFGAGLLHIALDFPLHHDDGRAHFWPFSDWKFESPISYWDPHAFGHIVGPVEVALCLILTVLLLVRFRHWLSRGLTLLVFAAELVPIVLFRIWFS